MSKLTSVDIEIALATFFNKRTNLIVPNISWGMFNHECDLFVLTPSGYGWEVEIKTSKQDLIRDKEKRHGHNSSKIKFLYFAFPESLYEHHRHVPDRAGIIVVSEDLICTVKRNPEVHSRYKFTDQERYQIARLGALRIWGLKSTIRSINKKLRR